MSNKFSNIFNRDFYPTPNSVIDLMMINFKGESVFEPSAGKGNIIDYAKNNGAKDVLCCEINNDLATICKSKARFLKHDFLKVTAEEVSHISLIVMNPPFSQAKKHLLHAWEIAPEGCQIVSLYNSDSLYGYPYSSSDLKTIIDDYGTKQDLGNCFAQDAERKTEVNITCVKLFKPIYQTNTNFEGFYMDAEPEHRADMPGMVKYNEVQALVNNYIGSLKCFDKFRDIAGEMNNITSMTGFGRGFTFNVGYNEGVSTKEQFSKYYQKHCWNYIFSKMNLNKYLTTGVMKDVNDFAENQTKIPFTVKNVYRMFEVIVGTADHNFNRALVETIDEFTKHTHENRYNVEGWKTNLGHMLNKKFIINYVFRVKEYGEQKGNIEVYYGSRLDKLKDLIKVICNLTGMNYEDTTCLERFCSNFKGFESNRWYSWGFFEVKGFKKGTAHFKFQDDKIWELLNRRYAEIKGFTLPEKQYKREPKPDTAAAEQVETMQPAMFE